MQYNPPYTLPWLRRNELALELAPEAAVEEEAAAAPPVPQATEVTGATKAAEAAVETTEDDGQSAPSD